MNTTDTGTRRGPWKIIGKILGRTLFLLVESVLLLALTLYGAMFVLAKGPSPALRNIFVQSVRETSAVGFLANLYLTEEEIAAIEAKTEPEFVETDTSLINIPTEPAEETPQESTGPVADEWGLIDEDGDGIIVEEIRNDGYNGYMMVVLDPSRVIMGCFPESFGQKGYTVAQMVKEFGAVAGINAGGFADQNGSGDGSLPDSFVVYKGDIYCPCSVDDSLPNSIATPREEIDCQCRRSRSGFAGFDSNHILHVGRLSESSIEKKGIQYGASFGPVLISNGEPNTSLNSGLNPRTAIGQRSDGAVLLLVINGRQLTSLGASYQDLVDIFLDYGAVNACNMDGGSSSLMWYQGDYINHLASVVGIRKVPTTFLVMPEGGDGNG